VEEMQSIEILEDVLEAYNNAVLTSVFTFNDDNQDFFYVAFKDLEYF
jgi:hypothetical protein